MILLIIVIVLLALGALVLINLLALRSNKDFLATYWKNQNANAAKENELIYVVLGDSTAQGVGAKLPQHSYPSLIASWLEKQTARPVRIVNLSVSGAKAADVFDKQMPEMLRLGPPHIVTLCVGANDLDNFSTDDFDAKMKEIVRALPRETYVATLPSFGGRGSSQDWKAEEASKLIVNAVHTTNHHAVDLYSQTKGNKGFRYHAADLYHPNARAYASWAVIFEKAMAERIPELIQLKK